MTGHVFPTIREALNATATGAQQPMKALAAELDWSPSELSHRTTLGGDSLKPFPADDEHLVKLMRVTGNASVLFTLADLLGYEVRPKEARLGELLAELKQDIVRLTPKMQMVLDLGELPGKSKARAAR